MHESFDKRSICSLLNQDALLTRGRGLLPPDLLGLASLELMPLCVAVHTLRCVFDNVPCTLDIETFGTELNLFRAAACILALRRIQERVAAVAEIVYHCAPRHRESYEKQVRRSRGMCIFTLAADHRQGIGRSFEHDPGWPDEKYWSIWFSTNVHASMSTPTPISTFANRALTTVAIMQNKLRDALLNAREVGADCSAAISTEAVAEFRPLIYEGFGKEVIVSANTCLVTAGHDAHQVSRAIAGVEEGFQTLYQALQERLYGMHTQPLSATIIADEDASNSASTCPCFPPEDMSDSTDPRRNDVGHTAIEIEEVEDETTQAAGPSTPIPGTTVGSDTAQATDDADSQDVDVEDALSVILPQFTEEKSDAEQFLDATLGFVEQSMPESRLRDADDEHTERATRVTPLPGGAKVETLKSYVSPDKSQTALAYKSVSFQSQSNVR